MRVDSLGCFCGTKGWECDRGRLRPGDVELAACPGDGLVERFGAVRLPVVHVSGALHVPIGPVALHGPERELRRKLLAPKSDLRVPHDHVVDFLLRALLPLRHAAYSHQLTMRWPDPTTTPPCAISGFRSETWREMRRSSWTWARSLDLSRERSGPASCWSPTPWQSPGSP